ncbi:MAG: hypothetical protein K1X75_12080 [Leptospirales bacterium]|nr:hypothetical protein [Leptospirales bacterium]
MRERRPILWLSALCCALALSALFAERPPHGQDGGPPGDGRVTLSIVALGAWSGDFGIDREGRGGLAALASYLKRLREQRAASGGGVLLVQSGDFSGARDTATLLQRMVYPEFELSERLGFQAMAMSGSETILLETMEQRALRNLPVVAFNRRPMNQKIPAYRIAEAAQAQVWITAAQSGPQSSFGALSGVALADAIRRQSGADFFVLLLDNSAGDGAWQRSSEALAQESFWQQLFPQDLADFDPYRARPHPLAERMLIVEAPAERSNFRRLPEGPFLCRIHGRELCQLDVELRGDVVQGFRQQFLSLNGASSPMAWIAPDPIVLRALSRRLPAPAGPDSQRAADPARGPEQRTEQQDAPDARSNSGAASPARPVAPAAQIGL